MALNIQTEFTPRVNPPNADYPTGSFRDSSLPGVYDGTPLRAIDRNDFQGFTDALLAAAGITHNGVADTATSSQRFDALLAVIAAATGLTPVSGGGALEVGKRYWITDGSTYTLPVIASLSDGNSVEVYKVGGATEPVIQVEGSGGEQIDYFSPTTGVLIDTDTSATYNIFAPLTFVLNGTKWEL